MRSQVPQHADVFLKQAEVHACRFHVIDRPDQSTVNQLINGQASIETVDAPTRQKMVDDMAGWHVQTVIVGPMAYQNEAVALYSELLNRQPEAVGDVYVWWGVDASHG